MNQAQKALYDRQARVLGEEAMVKMAGTNCLIVGLGGLGVEIAKNVILTGIGSVTLHDPNPVTYSDLSSQFFVSESSVGKNRVSECKSQLSELNQFVSVNEYHGELDETFLSKFQIVVFADTPFASLSKYNSICRQNGTKFIAAESRGLFGAIFTDFGDSFEVNDVDGEEPIIRLITSVTPNENGQGITVTVHDEERHGLQDGDIVKFTDIQGVGLDFLNNTAEPFEIKSTGPYTFSVQSVTITDKDAKYERGGYVTQVKKKTKVTFKSLTEALENPTFVDYDFAKLEHPPQLHACFRALAQFNEKHKRFPGSYNKADAEEFVKIASEIATSSKIT